MRSLHPDAIEAVTADDLERWYAYPPDRTWVRANMVSTIDGAIRGSDGLAKSITTRADQQVFNLARRACDVILVGAGTVRAEDYKPSRRTVALVSARLDVPLSLRMFADRTDEHPRPIVLTTDEAAPRAPDNLRAAADIVPCGSGVVDARLAIDTLAARGLTRILCEGGPTLLSALIHDDLVDELLLTVSPLLVGAPRWEHIVDIPGGPPGDRRFRPTQVLEEDGTVLMRMERAR